MSLSTRSIITLNQAKQHIGIDVADTSQDTMLESWIDICSGQVESFIDNKVKLQPIEEFLDGNGSYSICPHYFPVNDIYNEADDDAERLANIQYRTYAVDAWVNLLDNYSYVHIDPYDSHKITILDDYKYFPIGTKNIRIKYFAGWETAPAELQKVVIEMVAMMWKESDKGDSMLAVQASSSPESSVSLIDLNPRWERVLAKYRRYQ